MILRSATDGDADALEHSSSAARDHRGSMKSRRLWADCWDWCRDPTHRELDRQVVVAVEDDEVVGVAAHERLEHERFGPLVAHRYLMVVAVRPRQRRSGIARLITESLFVAMQAEGIETVSWLVAPRNAASLSFSRKVFPEADETLPPEDRPYVRFQLSL